MDNKEKIEKDFTTINTIIGGLYQNAYNSKDLEEYIVKDKSFDSQARNILLLNFYKLRTAIKNEKTLMMYLINNIVFRSNCDLENIAFM